MRRVEGGNVKGDEVSGQPWRTRKVDVTYILYLFGYSSHHAKTAQEPGSLFPVFCVDTLEYKGKKNFRGQVPSPIQFASCHLI